MTQKSCAVGMRNAKLGNHLELDLVDTVRKFCFHFSRVVGSVVITSLSTLARAWSVNYALRDAQNVCALTIVGTVLKFIHQNSVHVFGKNINMAMSY